MKIFKRKNFGNVIKRTVILAGILIVSVTSFNTSYADKHCKLVCTSNGAGGSDCVFVPSGCNNASKLGVPNSRLQQLINPKLVNPQLINPKRRLLPGDQFKANTLK